MQPPTSLVTDLESAPPPAAEKTADPARDALAKAGALLVDLADHATRLATLLAESARAKNLAGGLCRRAELARLLGRKLAFFSDPRALTTAALVNDAILALDGVAVDVEYAADFAGDVKIKNQVARARLAVTTAGCAIGDARHAISTRA